MWTFGIAWFHFVSEWKIYKTAGLGGGLLSPLIVASIHPPILNLILATSIIWMFMQKEYYLST